MTDAAAPRRTKQDERREATRAELIRLGLERMPVGGYAATSTRDIVAGSSLTKGAFDYHFKSKAEFFLELLQVIAGPAGSYAALAREHPSATIEEAITLLVYTGSPVGGPNGDWMLTIGDFVRTDGSSGEYRERLAELYVHWRDEIARWIEVLQEQGLARTDLPAETLATAGYATVEGHVAHMRIHGQSGDTVVMTLARLLRP